MSETFKERFRRDLETARVDKQIHEGRRTIVQEKQIGLWDKLRGGAKRAVEDINSGNDPILLFVDSDHGEPPNFSIIYNRADQQRKATALFDPLNHTVRVTVIFPGKQISPKVLHIVEKDRDVVFELNTASQDQKTVIEDMLNTLLH